MNQLFVLALILILFISGCTTIVQSSETPDDSLNSSEVTQELDSVLLNESDDVEIGSLI